MASAKPSSASRGTTPSSPSSHSVPRSSRRRSFESRAKAMDALRHFKARVETGEVARSDAVPEGERAERKFKQRPAQPLEASELEKVGA